MADCIAEELSSNLHTPVILYTSSGCFQGLVVEANPDCCKLICCSRHTFGRVTVCRTCNVQAVTFCNSNSICCFR